MIEIVVMLKESVSEESVERIVKAIREVTKGDDVQSIEVFDVNEVED